MININDLENELKNAYRKWKSSAYFDKFQTYNVKKIADFEYKTLYQDFSFSDSQSQNICSELAQRVIDEKERLNLFTEIISKINVRCYPKKFFNDNNDNNDNEPIIISNVPPKKICIEKFQYRIELPIEAHILGVLWIMKFGDLLDQSLDSQCYGNRLRENIYINKTDEKCTPYLFFPYFTKYESWRDTALDISETLLNANLNVAMITLDIEGYFYNCRVNFSELRQELTKFEKENQLDSNINDYQFLTDLIEQIFVHYSQFFSCKNSFGHDIEIINPLIPIGFLPSNIISNWYLKKFDYEIRSKLNPEYYGRYVDDILLVYSINNINVDEKELIEKLIIKPSNIFTLKNNKKRIEINTKYLNSGAIPLTVNQSKVKVFYFSHENSRKTIETFRETIKSQSSVFNYLHEDEKELLKDMPNKVWHIDYEDSPQKIRSVHSLTLDKFNLSKWLAFLVNFGEKIDSESYNLIKKALFDSLSGNRYIENFPFWEKYILFFYKQNQIDDLEEFTSGLLQSLGNFSPEKEDKNRKSNTTNIYSLVNHKELSLVVINLLDDFISLLYKSLSLKDNTKNKKIIELLENKIDKFTQKYGISNEIDILFTKKFLLSHLYNSSIIPYPLKQIMDNENYDLLDDKEPYISLSTEDNADIFIKGLELFPRFIHFNELQMLYLGFHVPKVERGNNYDKVWRWFYKLNYDLNDKTINQKIYQRNNESISICNESFNTLPFTQQCRFVSVGDISSKRTLRIGIANISLKEERFNSFFTDEKSNNFSDKEAISKIINDAIERKVDLLVLPECSVDHNWVIRLAKVSRESQMAMVFGLEPIIYKKQAYNFIATLLPFKIGQFNNCVIEFRKKNHYSPNEKKIIENYFLHEPENTTFYSAFQWRNLCFAPYCCYEIASIEDRALFKSIIDAIIVVEWNKDTNYFSNIVESVVRDLHCYCIQTNSSDFGDNRLTQPTSSENMDIIRAKGGINEYLIVADLDIMKLRSFQKKGPQLQKEDGFFKQTPPGFNKAHLSLRDKKGFKNKP